MFLHMNNMQIEGNVFSLLFKNFFNSFCLYKTVQLLSSGCSCQFKVLKKPILVPEVLHHHQDHL